MAHLPEELAEFAEALSISPRLNAFSSRDSSRATRMRTELFRRIKDGNLLQIRVDLDDRLTWFSPHPLFRYLPRPCGPKCRCTRTGHMRKEQGVRNTPVARPTRASIRPILTRTM